jgi:SWIM zinc finger
MELSKSRYGWGWLLAATAHIRKIPKTTKAQLWKVESERITGHYYNVIEEADGMICDCPDFEQRGEICKHILSVAIRYTKVVW